MNFSYEQYAAEQSRLANKANAQKIGWFKLADGQDAVVRFNVSSLEDLQFATVHTVHTKDNKWMRISCLNEFGSFGDNCPLCTAAAAGDASISKAQKKCYVQLLVSYRDPASGNFTTPEPVIWERAAGFSKELAMALQDYGNLRDVLFKITRTGAKLDTRYNLSYAMPSIYKPEMIPADFSAFDNFHIDKHSYWVKTKDEIESYLLNGVFPEVKTDNATANPTVNATASTPRFTAPAVDTNAQAQAAKADADAEFAAAHIVTQQQQQSTPTQPTYNYNAPTNAAPTEPSTPTMPHRFSF